MRYDILKYGVTQSQLMNYLGCRKYAELSHEGWRQKDQPSYFRYGEVTHGVLEEVYGKWTKPPTEKEIRALVKGQQEKYSKGNKLFVQPEDDQKIEIQTVMLEVVLMEYFQFWKKDDFGKVTWLEQEREFAFQVKIPGAGLITLKGKRDASYKENDEICLFETKTKGQIDEGTLRELLAMDFQVDLYSLSIRNDYKKFPNACRYNIIRRPGNKLGKNEGLDKFAERLKASIRENPAYYFIRYRIDITKGHMDDFMKDLDAIMLEFWQWSNEHIPTYKNTRSCVTKYGTCQYLPICSYKNYERFHQVKTIHPELKNQEAL